MSNPIATTPEPAVTTGSASGQSPRERTLSEFAAWMLSRTEDDLAMMGVEASVEEPMRLLRAYTRQNGLNLS